ncbi:nucleotidyltransferase family protein [Nocardioides coralli]|uniref:nucleotidyltransferase family protein n=1 Tax=Nocardioides coralli TaxID=2872154 RepID=UPI001CA3B0E3|nr:nucleotidyltransferase family protein [Nocardioides coralli]QZY28695.1 nucleotidyltransferase family protein [Nocardioides coralli]
MSVHGLLLAAGAGSRMGRPKALVVEDDGTPWLTRAVEALLSGGCEAVTVVLGAAADEAASLLPEGSARVVVADDWAAGMGASLRNGLAALAATDADAVLVTLVDLPDVGPEVCRRVLDAATGPDALARATYAGRPGHPVLLGRHHWAGAAGSAEGDTGARAYLARHAVTDVECGDLATGHDVDTPPVP